MSDRLKTTRSMEPHHIRYAVAWANERAGWCVYEVLSGLEMRYISGPYPTAAAAEEAKP